jgi:hypothetical protein
MWDVLYIEGSTPDIGIRRQHLLCIMLEEELKLKVAQASPLGREWDISIIIEDEERKYSLKTTERISVIKVAWNGFPSIERARRFQFKYPILYISGNRKEKRISIYVFEVDDLEGLKNEIGDDMWWLPRRGTNPRGFGINTKTLKILMSKAKEKGNFMEIEYQPVDLNIIKEKYWKTWYNALKKLILEG